MLRKDQRVNKHLFNEVFSRGQNISGEKMYLKILDIPEGKKASVVAPKKAARTAVSRALLRRRGYAALRELWDSVPEHKALLLFYKPGTTGIKYEAVREELSKLLQKTS